MLLAGFDAGLQSDSVLRTRIAIRPSLRAKRSNPSRLKMKEWIASAFAQELRRTSRRLRSLAQARSVCSQARMGKTGSETMFEKNLLAGKRILVTGGGSGLGAAMGRRFIE